MSIKDKLLPENEFNDTLFPDDTDSDFELESRIAEEARMLQTSELPSFIEQMY